MRKIFSAVAAAVIAAALITPNAGNVSGSVYNSSSSDERMYYCIVKFDDAPMAEYDYSKQNGVDKFIFTEEGQAVYSSLMEYHDNVQLLINTFLGRNAERLYDYTAVYNGFSLILSDSEYRELSQMKEGIGAADIYKAEPYAESEESGGNSYQEMSDEVSYKDMTDRIMEQTGISDMEHRGDSTVISIIDGGFDSSHEFLNSLPDGVTGRIDSDYIDDISPFLSAAGAGGKDYYRNSKIPFSFNYYTHTNDTSDADEVLVSHGTHVAGIAGGNGSKETDPVFDPEGTAPEAQLLLMGTNMSKACIMAAYDDSAYLGADIVNLSFGSDYMPVAAEPYINESLVNLSSAGAMICAAAGNASKIKFNGAEAFFNMDYSAGGIPSGLDSVLSVGSAENIVVEKRTVTAGNENYIVLSSGTYDICEEFADKTMEIAVVPGIGSSEDFEGIDVKDKIAVIRRGTITFEEKAFNAMLCGAVGVIFCNNVDEDFNASINCQSLPSCILRFEEGERLINSGETEVTFNSENKLFTNMRDSISSFSTWGFTENLVIKPDITAYGGFIVSSLPDGNYGVKAGTSMASPQISGMAAILKEYLKNNKEKYGIENDTDYPELIAKLLMSTAVPVYNNECSELASPRVQGSGLANIEKAVNTPAYLYTDSQEDNYRPKLSLGDKLDVKSGDAQFSAEKFHFHIKNISDSEQTYRLSADIMSDYVENGELRFNTTAMNESKVVFMVGMTKTDKVTVGPGEDIVINAELILSENDRNQIENTFPNGTFIDGFIYLKSDSAPELSLPFMGYYGSWDKSGIFEPFAYGNTSGTALVNSVLGDSNRNFAGINAISNALDGSINITFPYYSPNGDNVLDDINVMLAFKRRCKNIKAELFKENTCVYSERLSPGVGSADPEGRYSEYILDWNFDDSVSEDDIYTLVVTAEKPFSENGSDYEIISQQFMVDLSSPVINECRELDINGGRYMLIKASDKQGIQGAVMNEDFDYNYCEKGSVPEYYAVLKLPDNESDAHAVVYDIAGNSADVTVTDMTNDKYTLTYDNKLFFSTNDKSFRGKIIMKDSAGKNVNYMIQYDPATAYRDGINEIAVMMNYCTIATVPVSVGLAGDADMNDMVNLHDVIRVAKYLVWKANPNGPLKAEFSGYGDTLGAYLADFDGNGSVNISDAVGIAKSIMPSNS